MSRTIKHARRRDAGTDRTGIIVVVGLLFALICELFVFNLPYWQTRHAQPQDIADVVLGSGLQRQGDDLVVASADRAYIEIHADDPIAYVRVNLRETSDRNDFVRVSLTTQQMGTTGWYNSGFTKSISARYADSTYMHVDNRAANIRLRIRSDVGAVVPFRSVTVNPRIAMSLNPVRLAMLCLLVLLIALFRPSSPLYRVRLVPVLTPSTLQFWGIAAFVVVQMLLVARIWVLVGGSEWAELGSHEHYGFTLEHDQYALLGDALVHGRTNLDLPVPQSLAALDNPYDPDRRGALIAQGDGPIYWDHAFHDGKYYSYFGVVPAVVLYVPYQLVTGHWLNTSVAVLVLALIASMLFAVVTVRICRTYFDGKVSYGTVLLSMIVVALGSSLYYQVFTPNFYSVPGVLSLVVTLAGLSFWLAAKRRNLSKALIAAGSLCMALNLGSRPQFILAAVLALPIFWDELVHRRLFFSLKGVGNTVAAFLPFAIVFVPLLWYNHIRFGSWFDFGASYNLTGFDMVHMTFPARNILPLMFYYFFQPANVTGMFPFVSGTSTFLPVWSATEPSAGSIFALCPFLFLPVLMLCTRSGRRNRLAGVMACALAVSLGIVVADAVTAGLAWRYYLVFSWLFCLSTILVIQHIDRHAMAAYEQTDPEELARSARTVELIAAFRVLLLVTVVSSALLQFFAVFMPQRLSALIATNPESYFAVERWFLPFS